MNCWLELKLKMSLNKLKISADAYLVCLTHVLSTESTEVMGVLLGSVEDGGVCRVISAKALVRLDKRKDRVEISSHQLMSGATEAERLAVELRRTVRVVGWYHSHPHITVWPSAVDIDTQHAYQMMDDGFAGLIFSVFPKDQSAGVQAACFQSVADGTGALKRKDVPVCVEPSRTIAPHCLRALSGLPEALREEEVASYDAVRPASNSDQLTEMHNQAVLVSNITQQLGLLTMPLLQMMENRLERNQRQLRRLLAERDSLAERLGSAAVKREPSKADVDSGAETDLRLSDDETGGAAHSPSSEDTVYLQSAAERELGVSSTRRPLKVESDSDSDSTVSLELARSRRQPRVKRERDSDTEELPTESEGGRLRRRLTVVKEEPDL
ncbi:lys-63-specific deubiquitinase BRCC36-like isoform X5 [Amphibalanus amphitrite]|uniref:lys-63-specific deubiquitinase BRCC36-like isoform X5 n=1 Tax=Amphibalanus amphitrite TaxID=1232801 RepID=UPI001C918C45|nr:lys-63-specific deubiquitinase BRCC36-like isoform X5 [Amphibalanus amphitrite]